MKTGSWNLTAPFNVYSEELPQAPGVYCIYDNAAKKLLYIGSSVNLAMRLRSHGIKKLKCRDHIKTPWGEIERLELLVKYKTFRNNGRWLDLEYRLIKRLRPIYNKRGVVL